MMLASVWGWYTKQLSRRPLLTQAWSTGIMSGMGDLIAQQGVEGRGLRDHDWGRTSRFSAVGFLFVGPTIGTWYARLDRIVGPSLTAKVALRKMLLDQFCFAPVFFSCLLPVLWLSQGFPPANLPQKLRQDYSTVMMANYKVWPAVQMMNFYLVPLKFRLNVSNMAAVGWNSYLSWRAHHSPTANPPEHIHTKK